MLEGLTAAGWGGEGEKQNHFVFSCPCSDRAGEISFTPSWAWPGLCTDFRRACPHPVDPWAVSRQSSLALLDPSITLWFLPPQCFIALMQHSQQAALAVLLSQPRKWKQRWEVISWTYCRQPEADPHSEILLLDSWFPAPPHCQAEQGISFPAPQCNVKCSFYISKTAPSQHPWASLPCRGRCFFLLQVISLPAHSRIPEESLQGNRKPTWKPAEEKENQHCWFLFDFSTLVHY